MHAPNLELLSVKVSFLTKEHTLFCGAERAVDSLGVLLFTEV
jgi:hypothetical protein